MPNLLIMRHAKSDWNTGVADVERPLNPRGRRDAKAMADWLARQAPRIECIFSSPARRARQTAEIVAETMELDATRVIVQQALYLASRRTLVQVLNAQLPRCTAGLLLVGHNPGLDELVTWLASAPLPRTAQGKLMTTAAVASFAVADGQSLAPGAGRLRFLARPRELRAAGWPDMTP